MSDTLRDQVEAAYNSSMKEEETQEEVLDVAEDAEEEEVEAEDAPAESSDREEPQDEDVAAPEHWAAEDKEVFKSLDKRGKEFLIRRHKDMEAGFTKKAQALSESAKLAENYKNMLSPHEAYLKELNIDPSVAFNKLMAAERVLRTGSPEEKSLMMHNLAQQYKADLSAQVDPVHYEKQVMWQKLQEIERQQIALANMKDEEVNNSYKSQITAFANSKDDKGNLKYPHFEELRHKMGSLINAGMATTLEEAHEQAILLNEELRKEYIAKQYRKEGDAKRVVASKKAGFNVKSGSGGQISDPKRELSMRELLSQAYDAQTRR